MSGFKSYPNVVCSYCGNVKHCVKITNTSGKIESWICYACLRSAGLVLVNDLFDAHQNKFDPEEKT